MFIYSENATKYCETSTLLLFYVVPVKSKVEIFAKFCGLLRIYELYHYFLDEIPQNWVELGTAVVALHAFECGMMMLNASFAPFSRSFRSV